MKIIVKWGWWYPEGGIRGDADQGEFDVAEFDEGEDVAQAIVQKYIDENGTDGAQTFEIEIFEPAEMAGAYEFGVDWSPVLYLTQKRWPSNADTDDQADDGQSDPGAASSVGDHPVGSS